MRLRADRLKQGISLLSKLNSDHEILNDVRTRIQGKMEEEKERQVRFGLCSDSLLAVAATKNGESQDDQEASIEGEQELEHEMSIHDHVHVIEETHFLIVDGEGSAHTERFQMDYEVLEELVNFWHEMELLVLAATRLSLKIYDEEENDSWPDERQPEWQIVHGLSITGCPREIANLAVKLYPEQVRTAEEDGNLPLHLASLSHQTSALADGTWHHDQKPYGQNASTAPPMMECLLNEYPEAASEKNNAGSYSLNLAILAGKTWQDGAGDIFRAGPNIVLDGSVDSIFGLPPFMLAALPRYYSAIDYNSRLKVRESSFEEEMRAKRSASKNIGSMWMLLPDSSKVRALSEAKLDIDKMQLTTIYQLLRVVPEFIGGFGVA